MYNCGKAAEKNIIFKLLTCYSNYNNNDKALLV